jgi:hypothetical protein
MSYFLYPSHFRIVISVILFCNLDGIHSHIHCCSLTHTTIEKKKVKKQKKTKKKQHRRELNTHTEATHYVTIRRCR